MRVAIALTPNCCVRRAANTAGNGEQSIPSANTLPAMGATTPANTSDILTTIYNDEARSTQRRYAWHGGSNSNPAAGLLQRVRLSSVKDLPLAWLEDGTA